MIIDYIKPVESQQIVLLICLNSTEFKPSMISYQNIKIGFGFVFPIILTSCIMYLSAYCKTNRAKNPTGVKYQRNIMTFLQSLLYGVTVILFSASLSLLTVFGPKFNIPNRTLREIIFIHNIVIYDILYSFLVPLLIMFNLGRKMPEFYIKPNQVAAQNSNIFIPSIEPRRDFASLEAIEERTTQRSRFIFVKCKEELPFTFQEEDHSENIELQSL